MNEGSAWESSRPWMAPAMCALLIAACFAPLLAGYHFLPLSRFPGYTQGLVASSGGDLPRDDSYLAERSAYPWLGDMEPGWFTFQLPQDWFAAEAMRRGSLPLWDPYTGCGAPTFGSGQFRPFNPFRLPFLLIPSLWTYALSLLLALCFGAWGAWRWLRSEGLNPEASALGAALFALNPWSLERILLQDASAYYILPWCILGLRPARLGDWRSMARAGVPLVLMGNMGHPEACLVLALVAGLAALAHEGAAGREFRKALPALGAVAVWVILCLTLLWFAPLELLRFGSSYRDVAMGWNLTYAWEALFAPASDLYLLPALAGLVVAGALWGKGRLLWVGLGVACLLLILPIPGFGHGAAEFLQRRAGFAVFYLKPALWISACYLAAAGWDALRHHPRRAALASGVGLLFLLGGAGLLASPPPGPAGALCFLPGLLVPLAAAGVLALFWAFRTSAKQATTLALGAVLLPLAFPLPGGHLGWNRTRLGQHDCALWMRREAPHARAVSPGFDPSFAIPPNWGQALRTRMGEENAALFPNRYLELFWDRRFPMTFVMFDRPQMEAFRQMGASLVLLPDSFPVAEGAATLFRGRWASAHPVPGAAGRLYFARSVALLDPSKSLSGQIVALGGGADGAAVVDAPNQPQPPSLPPASGPSAAAAFVEDGMNEVGVSTKNPWPGLLVLRDTWYPGWKAEVDGTEVPLFRANGCFRSVAVPAGEHRVRFVYRPRALYQAGAVSGIATLALVTVALVGRKRDE